MTEPVSLPRVLVADDEQAALEIFSMVLAPIRNDGLDRLKADLFGGGPSKAVPAGYDLVLCSQGDQALEAVREAVGTNRRFRVVFLDVRMPPGPDGIETAEAIRALDPDTHIVIVTAYSDRGLEEIAARIQPPDKLFYVEKPLHAREIKQFVAALCAKWRVERALRESEERYALAVQGASEAIWDWDLRTGTKFLSPRLIALLGGDEEILDPDGEAWIARILPSHQQEFRTALRRHLDGESAVFSCEYPMASAEGALVWLHDRGVALRDKQGQPYRMAGSIGDVTGRRATEERLRHAGKMEALGQMASGVAHEFNNLLVGILAFAELAAVKMDDAGHVTRCVEQIVKACRRATVFSDELLTFSRGGLVKSSVTSIRVGKLIEEATTLLRPALGPGIQLHIQFEGEASMAVVLADQSHMLQVLTNLILNARDAMPEGGDLTVSARVVAGDGAFEARLSGRHVAIAVGDTGTGIAPEVLEHVLEPFFTTKAMGKGTGLGLALTHGLVQQAGGVMDVESTVGVGSTFTVYLPMEIEARDE